MAIGLSHTNTALPHESSGCRASGMQVHRATDSHCRTTQRLTFRETVVFGIPHTPQPMFGTFIKDLRMQQRRGLREFCLEHGHDPSNWSKIEREVLPPPRDEKILREWADQLRIKRGSDEWLKFFEYAAVDTGRIPEHVLREEKVLEHLPLFFRTLSGQKPSREDLEKLLKIIKGTRRV